MVTTSRPDRLYAKTVFKYSMVKTGYDLIPIEGKTQVFLSNFIYGGRSLVKIHNGILMEADFIQNLLPVTYFRSNGMNPV